mgnify:CR=1 FL=1
MFLCLRQINNLWYFATFKTRMVMLFLLQGGSENASKILNGLIIGEEI